MGSSFNAFGQTNKVYGASTPVWLGTVSPTAIGGVLAEEYCFPGAFYPAGTPVRLENKVITPVAYVDITPIQEGSIYLVHEGGAIPTPGWKVLCFGNNGGKISASSILAVKKVSGGYEITVEGKLSLPTCALSPDEDVAVPTHYLYNDIFMGDIDENAAASGSCVNFHGEGILIDRTPGVYAAEYLQECIPHVAQIKG